MINDCLLLVLFSFLCLVCVQVLASTSASDSPTDLEFSSDQPVDNSALFEHQYLHYKHVCKGEQNRVPPRYDGVNNDQAAPYREWSLNSMAVHHYLGIHSQHVHSLLPPCSTPEQIAEAFQNAPETPRCKISWYSPLSLCKLFSKYAQVYWFGDSLARHLTLGMYSIFRNDFRYGAYPTYENPLELLSNCSCDGQFSESLVCRTYNHKVQYRVTDFRYLGLCSDYDPAAYSSVQRSYRFFETEFSQYPFNGVLFQFGDVLTCRALENRPMFLMIQGSVHHGYEIQRVLSHFFEPLMKEFAPILNECPHLLHMVYIGGTVCAPEVETKYPQQEQQRVRTFNSEFQAWLKEHYPKAVFLNPVNLSSAALNRTSDGFHFLTDTNFILATTLFNLMNVLAP